MKRIKELVLSFFRWVVWKFRKKRRRLYIVKRCSTASFIGMKSVGEPKIGKEYLLLSNKIGYRTVLPLQVRKVKDGYDIYAKYNRIFIKRYF